MEATRNERYIAGATPVLIFVSGYVSGWLIAALPILLYFIYRKYSLNFAQTTVLKILDLSISLILLAFGLGLLNSALLIVAQDHNLTIPLVSSGLSKYIIAIPLLIYYLVYLIMFSISSIRGKSLNAHLSFKIFETLRGKRAVVL